MRDGKGRAILFVLGSSGSFTLASALVKVASSGVSTTEVVFFRNVFALLVLAPLVVQGGGWRVLRTRRPWGQVWRGVGGLGSMFGTFYGYAHLPIAVVTALSFAMPLFLAVLSVPLLGERVSLGRAGSIAAGFVGVLMVIRPWEGGAGVPGWDAAVVLGGVAAWAAAMVSIRRMGQAGERNVTIVTWYAVIGTAVSTAAVVPVWVTPGWGILAALVGVGVISAGAQLLMTEGYRNGEASMLAPFEYSAIFYTVAMGWAVWGEVPGPWEAGGIAVLVASGLATWWREARG